MRKKRIMKTALLAASLVAWSSVAQVAAPFTDDYGTGVGQVDVLNTNIYTVTDSESTVGDPLWSTHADSLHLARTNAGYSSGYATVETDLSAAAMTDFTMTSTVTMSTNGGVAFSRFGFVFLADTTNSTGLTAIFYPNQGTGSGQLRIRDYAFGNANVDPVNRTSGGVTNGSEYTLTLYGDFNGAGDLDLALSVVNADEGGSEDLLLSTIPAASLPSGIEFGIAGRVADFAGDYDSLSVIPSAQLAVDDEYILPLSSSTNVAAPGVLANDLGADSVVLVDDISSGSLTLNADGSFSCSGLADGTNTFTYAAVSGSVTSAPATVTLNAVLSEAPPTAVDDSYAMDLGLGDSNIMGNVLDNDINNSLIYDLSVMEDDYTVDNGTLNVSVDGGFTYTPNVGFVGVETFAYKAFTPLATSIVATVTLTVEDNNVSPEPAFFDFVDGGEFDNKGLGVTMTRANNLGEEITITTVEIIGGDGTSATNGTSNKTNIQSVDALGVNSANLGNADYGSESRDFNPGEAWVISFDVDVSLDQVDLASQSVSTEMTISSPAFSDIVMQGEGDGNTSGVWDFTGIVIPAGTNVMFQMTSLDTAADTQLRIDSLSVSITNKVVTTPYEDWVADQGLTNGVAAYDDDPDEDNMDNLLEYALGGNALSDDAATFLPGYEVLADGSTNYLNYVYRRRTDFVARGLTYEVGSTLNLTLEPATNATEQLTPGAIDATFESVTNRVLMDDEAVQFMQLNVTID
ncbi:Ig-like domain-containing protein [Pontiellaceae bacterium B12227]|nr:Ig-like domain-containing protein [Pontiellaceae bacterium B12227]